MAAIALLAVIGLTSCAISHGPVGPLADIVVTEAGNDSKVESCQGFAVTAADVASFFGRAVLITHGEAHDHFLRGPCFVRGTLATRYGRWHWEIRNMGTGQLTSASGDDVFLFGDPRQESSLGIE